MNKGKFRIKCVEKMMRAPKGARRKFLDMPIDHRNLLWNINFLKFPWLFLNFPDFQSNSKFPWQILQFPDFSLTLNFPDFSLTSGNPENSTDSSKPLCVQLNLLILRYLSWTWWRQRQGMFLLQDHINFPWWSYWLFIQIVLCVQN